MENKNILIVEDEKRLSDLLCDYLDQADYQTKCFYDGMNVVSWVKENRPSLILLDLMLPGKDGIEICKEIRQFSDVPIIMITARIEEIDKLLGLELGADDYICKPFSPREVMARVKAVLRRSSGKVRDNHILELDAEKYIATIQGKVLDLTAVEFQLLKILFDKEGRILPATSLWTESTQISVSFVIEQLKATSKSYGRKYRWLHRILKLFAPYTGLDINMKSLTLNTIVDTLGPKIEMDLIRVALDQLTKMRTHLTLFN